MNTLTKKFRAWDKKISRWRNIDKYERMAIFESPQFDIEQFIGVCDKNGKEIYEGDILYAGETHPAIIVDWFGSGFSMKVISPGYEIRTWFAPSMIEVIGNIHQHPDLLK